MSPDSRRGPVLRTGTEADAPQAADLHAGQIGEGFLTILGRGFLRRLYRRIVRVPDSFLLVVEDGATTVGFLAGSTDVAHLYRSFVVRDGAAAAIMCGGRILRSWRRVMETLGHGSGAAAGQGAELLSIAVDPAVQGRGVGTMLVDGFLAEIERRHQDAAHVVVAADNETAISLYRRVGFRTADRFELHSGTESLLMQWIAQPGSGLA